MAFARRLWTLLPGLAFIAFLLGALELVAHLGWVNTTFVPPTSAIATTCAHLIVTGLFAAPLLHTLVLLVVGYALGCAVAIGAGIVMGSSRVVFNLLEPLTELVRPVPKSALLPVLILFLGLGATMEITIIALSSFFPVLINTIQGVRGVDPTMIDTARTFGYGTRAIWTRILLPASLPFILAGMRISLGIGLVMVIIAEMLSGTGGLGDVILSAQRSFQVKDSYAWLVILALFGFVLIGLFDWAGRRLAFWHAPETQ
jgi:ABC-type nitrate/sulfonate/bicarbonate transport system permease component